MEKKPQSHQINSSPVNSKPKKILIDYIKTKYATIKIAIIPLILFFLIGGVFLTIYQSQQQQELRSRAASEPVDLELRPSSIVVRAGNTFTVFVYANMKSSPVTAMEINLSYPTTHLELTEYSNTSLFPDLVTDLFILPTGAKFSLGSGINPVNGGSGNIAVLKFKALQEQVNPIQISLNSATKVSLLGEKSVNFAGTLTPMSVTILSASNQQTQVQVVSPNAASDVWGAGLTQQVQWRYLPDSQTTKDNVATQIQLKQRVRQSNGIDVYTGVGPVYTTTSNDSTSGQVNTYSLAVPANTPLGGNYRIVVEVVPGVSSLGNNITFSDASDNDFTVALISPIPTPTGQPTHIRVISPNGGEAFYPGQTVSVQWVYAPDSQTTQDNVPTTIELKRRLAGSNIYEGIEPIYSTTSNAGNNNFSWTIPQDTPDNTLYRIFVEAVAPVAGDNRFNITFFDFSDNDFSIAVAPTSSPTPLPLPTNTPIPQPTNTPIPIPTNTPAPTPTIQPGSTTVRVAVKLVSIGDQANVENPDPINPTRTATVRIYDALNQLAKEVTGNLNFDGKIFVGNINLGTDVVNGSYFTMVKLDNTLRKRISGFQTLQKDVITSLPQEKLISADINDDNVLSIADWNIILRCFGESVCPEKRQSDLNDDGEVDIIDFNIFLNSLSVREGDEPPV